MKPPIAGRHLAFEATLENWAEGMDYCAVAVPAEITAALGTHRAVAVRATLDDAPPFAVSLFPVGDGRHYIRIRAAVRKAIGVKTGDRVRIGFTVLDPADVHPPADLAAALDAADATRAFDALPAGRRRFLIRGIDEAVRPETRRTRIASVVATVARRPT